MNNEKKFTIAALTLALLFILLGSAAAYLFLVKGYSLIAPPSERRIPSLPQIEEVKINSISGEITEVNQDRIIVKTYFGYEYIIFIIPDTKIYLIPPQSEPMPPDVVDKIKKVISTSGLKTGDFAVIKVMGSTFYQNNEVFAEEITVYE